jgi:hypothetical protein
MSSPHTLEMQALALLVELRYQSGLAAMAGDRPRTARLVQLGDRAAVRYRRRLALARRQSMPSHSSQAVCS